MFKFLVSVVVIIVVGGGLWWSGYLTKWVPSIPMPSDLMKTKTATTTAEVPTNTQQTSQQTPKNDLSTATDDASDEALVQDQTSLDTQLSGLSTDSANAQGSLSDKPVSQEY